MKNTITQSFLALGIILGLMLLSVILIVMRPMLAGATAPSGLQATVATSSPAGISVGTTASTVFATSTCSSRIISTVATPIMVTFSDFNGETPTGVFGHLQGASTTVAYDSGLYGCGALKVYGFGTTVITATETR